MRLSLQYHSSRLRFLTCPRPLRVSLLAAALVPGLPLHAGETRLPDAPTPESLAQRLLVIEQRLGVATAGPETGPLDLADLDRRLRALEAGLDRPAAIPGSPTVSLDAGSGLVVKSTDGGIQLQLRGLVQADGRFFLDDERPQNDTFLWRRIRPSLEGGWGELVGFRLTPEFAGDGASIVDAYVDLKFDPRATLRIGKVKGPVGLERLQGGGAIALAERGFPTELAPNREIGVQLQGALAQSRLNYAVGVYNGAPDGRDSPTTNPDDEFEFAARLFLEPWRGTDGALSGLGFGIAGSAGDKRGAGNDFLPRYRTPGQATFFNYRGTVAADGRHVRWSPQAYWYHGRFGLLGEYISSRQELFDSHSGARASLDNRAWQAVAGWVLTGEKAGYRGVRPDNPFTLGGPGRGALELVGRYGELDIDDDAFPLFADPAGAAASASAWSIGLNWYLTGHLKLVANYTRADFDRGGPGGDREDEKTFFTRAQFSF